MIKFVRENLGYACQELGFYTLSESAMKQLGTRKIGFLSVACQCLIFKRFFQIRSNKFDPVWWQSYASILNAIIQSCPIMTNEGDAQGVM